LPIDLTWLASFSASSIHAADALIHGHTFVDPALQQAIAGPSRELSAEIEAIGLEADETLERLNELASEFENNRQLAERALVKMVGDSRVSSEAIERLAGRIADVESAFRAVVPSVVDQLAVRGEPLRQQWETRGPGLLSAVGRLTEETLIVGSARVVLVQPVLGGGGVAQVRNNSVRIEAVLTNPEPTLPEPLRLGWLLAQLNQDLPIYSESIRPERIARLAGLAMLPPVLAAAEQVDWARLDEPTLRRAIDCWHVTSPSDPVATRAADDSRLAGTLLDWWTTYTESSPRWTVALAALDQMTPS